MATTLSLIAVLAALAAFGYAWKLQQELGQATRRLDRYNRALFETNDELRRLRDEVGETSAALRVELRQATGALRFEPTTTVREAERIHPQAAQVLADLHLGGCASCAVEPDDTLAGICDEKGVPLETLLANLNMLVGTQDAYSANGAPNGAPHLVKLPNVALDFD